MALLVFCVSFLGFGPQTDAIAEQRSDKSNQLYTVYTSLIPEGVATHFKHGYIL